MKCPRCKGMGSIPEYRHIRDGLCFRCRGSGIVAESWLEAVFGEKVARAIQEVNAALQKRGLTLDDMCWRWKPPQEAPGTAEYWLEAAGRERSQFWQKLFRAEAERLAREHAGRAQQAEPFPYWSEAIEKVSEEQHEYAEH